MSDDQRAGVDGFSAFRLAFRAKLVVVEGEQAGMEYLVDRARMTIGRGPDADPKYLDFDRLGEDLLLFTRDVAHGRA